MTFKNEMSNEITKKKRKKKPQDIFSFKKFTIFWTLMFNFCLLWKLPLQKFPCKFKAQVSVWHFCSLPGNFSSVFKRRTNRCLLYVIRCKFYLVLLKLVLLKLNILKYLKRKTIGRSNLVTKIKIKSLIHWTSQI